MSHVGLDPGVEPAIIKTLPHTYLICILTLLLASPTRNRHCASITATFYSRETVEPTPSYWRLHRDLAADSGHIIAIYRFSKWQQCDANSRGQNAAAAQPLAGPGEVGQVNASSWAN